ncbi:MAG: amidase [Candidatus Krumholzibacteria bacterium]|nr:amidase [Candidatus Krumholzibacteria bacterium]MDH4336121.1 amidase [Candidatus Krumholzibacteria bacterium]MDH5268762.1 amidase [Candidatus Krumholzibacteria bacterium]
MRIRAVLAISTTALAVGYIVGVAQGDLPFSKSDIAGAEKIIGLEFDDAERDSMQSDLADYLEGYGSMRATPVPNAVPPALVLRLASGPPPAASSGPRWSKPRKVKRPANLEDVAFWPVADLAELIRTKQVTSVELTTMYLARLKRYGPALECVVSLTEERAMDAARRADAEIARGKYRGPLHGMPYGAKDLLAVEGTKTTWGAMPYRDQTIDDTATVIRKLDEAGAVLVAKTTLGALAWGDVWFGGRTRNPWNTEKGSSGSSAGSASATAAGLVPFAIGTETWGSIVSPSTVCGTTGLRPTFGRVSRAGAMALSWSMDKIGPICRSVEDCAIVFQAIRGADGIDPAVVDGPFAYRPDVKLADLRIGFVKSMFEEDYPNRERDNATLEKLRALGATLTPIELPAMDASPLGCILSAEAAAAFDDLTRSNRDDLMVRQIKNAWPNTFRAARFIPAVEYIQANRIRTELMREMEKLPVDVYITPSFGGDNLLITNLTGHPCVVLPNGFDEDGEPTSITFMGRLYGDATVLAVARAYQEATDFHTRHPQAYR